MSKLLYHQSNWHVKAWLCNNSIHVKISGKRIPENCLTTHHLFFHNNFHRDIGAGETKGTYLQGFAIIMKEFTFYFGSACLIKTFTLLWKGAPSLRCFLLPRSFTTRLVNRYTLKSCILFSTYLGPDNWAKTYPKCGLKRQSPINILSDETHFRRAPITTNYRGSKPSVTFSLANNGHAAQVTLGNIGELHTLVFGKSWDSLQSSNAD